MSETKRCTKCGEVKGVGEFGKDRHAKDGIRRWCKKCAQTQRREKRAGVYVGVPAKHINAFGESHTLAEWSRKTGINCSTIELRIKNGWSVEDALSRPVRRAPSDIRECSKCHQSKPLDEFYEGNGCCKPCYINQLREVRGGKMRKLPDRILVYSVSQDGMKVCDRCMEEKVASDFYSKARKCKLCANIESKENAQTNRTLDPDGYLKQQRATRRKSRKKIRSLERHVGAHKTCKECGEHKCADYFYRDPGCTDGLSTYCKSCHYKRSRSNILKNVERNRKYQREWAVRDRRKKPDKYRERSRVEQRKRKAALRGAKIAAGDQLPTVQFYRDTLEYYDHRCAYCFCELEKVTWDHVVPVVRGGAHSTDNLVPACFSCNSSKNHKCLHDWLDLPILRRLREAA